MGMPMHCASCGIETRAGAIFCEHCGVRLPRVCPECGVEVGAAAVLCDGCGVQLTASPDAGLTQPVSTAGTSAPSLRLSDPTPPAAEPELRQATILFCDLAGSTALSTSLDPEDLRDVLRRYQAAAVSVIKQHNGVVSAYLGDGILVQFGYPRAREDDPESAIRAGLAVAAAVRELRVRPDLTLEVRVGIATGLTLVGDLIGEGASREVAVAGQTPNLAARLQSLAHPGEVIISDTTKRLGGAMFELVDLGPQDLKGFDEPVPAWQVEAERVVENRFEAIHAGSKLGPLVDREVEYPALLKAWRLASSGKGQVVTLRGEPGLGKSRLSEALRETVATGAHRVLRYYCSARFQNTALYPVIRHIQHAAGIAADDSPEVKLEKLESILSLGLTPSDVATQMPYFAPMLSIPTGDRYPSSGDSPERQRELTLRALQSQIINLASEQPVLIIFEDLHWVDPTTLSLIDQLVRSIAQTPVMLLATGRPEFAPPWAGLPNALTVELSRLERDDRSSIIEQHTGGKALPPEILEHILQKCDGIPLYVEELTKDMLESGLLQEEADRFVLTGPVRSLAVPSTLHDSLLARLDRLSVVKDVAQAGAAIGREFAYQTLAAALPLPSDELATSLHRLTEAGLIQRQGKPPNAVYAFKHALIQDAAYATMLRPKRRALHARIAQALESDPEAARRPPELLAHHLTEANQVDKAAPYLLEAGLQASASAAHAEARKHFEEGLRLVATLKDVNARQRLELSLRVHLGMSLAATGGYAAPEVEATNQRARELCRLIGETDELFWVLRGLCSLYIVRGDAKASQELVGHCVRLGEETQRAEFLIEGYAMRGYTLVYAGELEAGREALARAVDIYRTQGGARFPFPTPQDPAVACLSLLASVNLILGQTKRAVEYAADVLQTAEGLKRPFDAAYAHNFVAKFENLRGNPKCAAYHAGITIEISQRHGFGIWLAAGTMQLGVAKAALGETQEAIALLSATLPAWQASGAELNRGFFLAGLAEGYRGAGDLDKAIDTIAEAIDHAAHHDEHYYDAVLYRLSGELLSTRGGAAAQAEADFQRAIEIAQQQGADLFELRAKVSLARALVAAGERDRARELLASSVEKISGERDTADYRAAAALLDELAA